MPLLNNQTRIQSLGDFHASNCHLPGRGILASGQHPQCIGVDAHQSLLHSLCCCRNRDVPGGATGAAGAAGANAAPTPGGGTSITDAVQALGLKLESRKAEIEQLIV